MVKNFIFNINVILFYILLSSKLMASEDNILSIEILQSKHEVSYKNRTRLSEVLKDSFKILGYQPYTLSSAIFLKKNFRNLDKTKKKLIAEIKKSDIENANNIIKSLSKLNFHENEKLTLDIDKIRLNKNSNPLLNDDFYIYLPKKPDYILVFDSNAITPYKKIKVVENFSFQDYLKKHIKDKKTFNDFNFIKIIQADKKIISPQKNYWNNEKTYLSPGAVIFIGINSSSKIALKINKKLLHILKFNLEK